LKAGSMKRQGPHQDAEKSITICQAKSAREPDPRVPQIQGTEGRGKATRAEKGRGADQLAAALVGRPLLVVGGLGVRGHHGAVRVVGGRRGRH
jgi:hypothetical protein